MNHDDGVAAAAAALEVVIVHSPNSMNGRGESRVIGGHESLDGQVVSSCCCRRRKRHNATQTTCGNQQLTNRCCCVNQHQHQQSSSKRRALLCQQRRHRHHRRHQHSVDTSEKQSQQMHHQPIAIEIDAATTTMTEEDVSSTATSNFPFKATALQQQQGGVSPLILSPMREPRRCSLNSNTTIETDELSPDEDAEDVKIVTNERVKIKRKRFREEDFCSSCSSCSKHTSTSCSSSSSLDEDLNRNHELTVAAECHQCEGNCSCSCGDEDEDAECEEEEEDTTEQRESFCTAADHTILSHDTAMTPENEDTLTPSQQMDSTMRSDTAGIDDEGNLTDADASSLSQSAEYFSISSNNPVSSTSPLESQL
ncbi:uncharacterized protein LOC124460345 [Drosophila willistoni]|uniref:uncharacterized protein LOC124460345 n=1 Tax=Drosophila willistoni TaxID=7260 RepID=UPI001F08061C|nr:uncharacterized protein LOC124460345 [Drosophila willistoni]